MAGLPMLEFHPRDLKMKIPCTGLFVGPTLSGKTTLILQVVDNADELFDPPPKTIVYAYGQFDEGIHEFRKRGVMIVAGAPSDEFLQKIRKPALLILDDLMSNVKNTYLDDLYTKKAHHMNMAVFFVLQNMFDKASRVARMNSHYIFIMRAPNSALHIQTLGNIFSGF